MQIAYYDESGDDGYPAYSSEFFVLSALYLHYLNWRPIFDTIQKFRQDLKSTFGLPIRTEMHTKQFLLNKKPYRTLCISDDDRVTMVGLFCDLIASLDLKIINVVIVKQRIQKPNYPVLDSALKYSIQRIENDLKPTLNPQEKFMIITDPGRDGKMRKTSRRIQRINFIPSRFNPTAYRREIRTLIEDPLPKDSKESYFIQLADLVTLVVYLHSITETGVGQFSNRMRMIVTPLKVTEWMDRLKPSLNLLASSRDPYGIVFHPQ
ncbi:MAG: DUF3800 domain-containing protein [Chloroflexi bacterium]|nr:DUF3800 domain-containing protein [Chloroflexota bacterium]MBU1660897.1 DUF3800 domain-containing protein [Chloroflexota bacterium]